MSRWNPDEDVIHVYHMALEVLAKMSIMDSAYLQKLRGRFVQTAALERGEDSVAMRCLITALDAYTNSFEETK